MLLTVATSVSSRSKKIKKSARPLPYRVERGSDIQDDFRGAACNSCNLNFQEPKFITVIFHNLRRFDGHILCQRLIESYCAKYGTLREFFHWGFTLY